MRVLQIPYRSAGADSSDKRSSRPSKSLGDRKRGVWDDFEYLGGFRTVSRHNFSVPKVSEKPHLDTLAKPSLQARGIEDAL